MTPAELAERLEACVNAPECWVTSWSEWMVPVLQESAKELRRLAEVERYYKDQDGLIERALNRANNPTANKGIE